MKIIFKNEIIDYSFSNNNKKYTILFLHGWGGNKNSFCSIEKFLNFHFNLASITMPTMQPTLLSWTLFDYCELVENILLMHNVKEVVVICHSFGFRVACLLKNVMPIKKIIVTGGAGLKRISILKKIENQNKIIAIKNDPKLFYKFASNDYKNLTTANKKTFKNVVSQNLIKCCQFNCPMLLFWGKQDNETPLWIAKELQNKNKTKLILTNSDHFAYLKQNNMFIYEVLKFLNDLYS